MTSERTANQKKTHKNLRPAEFYRGDANYVSA